MKTYTYKRIGSLAIKADVYVPADTLERRPTVVYMHGGSLIGGGREKIAKMSLMKNFLADGYVVVSIDYRLGPETKLPGIVSDLEDAFQWVREKGPELFGADPSRMVAWGSSAGGYLALLSGYRVRPRPQVVVVEYGYGDIVGSWQTEPSRCAKHYQTHLPHDEALRLVSGPPIANHNDRANLAEGFNHYVRRQGKWPNAITGWAPDTEADQFIPYLPTRNVTTAYPSTFMIHGREDSDIPFTIAELMAAELGRNDVNYRLIGIVGGEHGYEGADPQLVAAAHFEAAAFVRTHLLRIGRP